MPTFESMAKGYANLWAKMTIRPEHQNAVHALVALITRNKTSYDPIAAQIGCPWWFIGIVHRLEAGGDFSAYLGNGQPLSRVTTAVPIGRGPFSSFEAGALDALYLEGIDKITDWSIPRALYQFEKYNGFGYGQHNINSPYVWSFSNLYSVGKFGSDGHYDAGLVSQQCGAAVILRAMIDMGYVTEIPVIIATVPKGATMDEVKAQLDPFAALAPTLIALIAGPVPALALKVLSEVLSLPIKSDAGAVTAKLGDTPPSKMPAIISAAENIAKALIPASTVLPASVPSPGVVPDAIPAPVAVAVPPVVMIPDPNAKGAFGPLDGYVTYLGIAVTAAGFVLGFLHTVTPEISNSIITVGLAVGGVGMKNAWEKARKVIPIIPALPTTA